MEKEKYFDYLKLNAWELKNKDIKDLDCKTVRVYFRSQFPDLKKAFVKEMAVAVCMDEGCAHKDYNGEGKLAVAGSGILLPAKSEEERVQIAARLFNELGIKNITSHEGCGAVGLAYKRDFPGSNPSKEELEEYGKAWTKKVTAEMDRMKCEARFDHIAAEEMVRPAEFHNARVVYFDGVGGFNPNHEADLPMGFVVSRRFLPGEYAAEELKVAISIAFGHHGFGELFTMEIPFIIIPLAGSEEELEKLKNEIEEALQGNEHFQNKKIKIDGLVVE